MASASTNALVENPFLQKYRGYLGGIMRWDDLTQLWNNIRQQQQAWYIYAVGEPVPDKPASHEQLDQFIQSIDALLRQEHDEDYCGIVYADNAESPCLVKIYDPNNLGVVCGFSENPPLPGWVMSQLLPLDLQQVFPPTSARKRWWQKIFP